MESGFFSNSTAIYSFLSCRSGSLAGTHNHCAIDLWLEQSELEFLVSWVQNCMNNSQDVTNTSSRKTFQVNSIFSSCILPCIAGLECSRFLAPPCLVSATSASWWQPTSNWFQVASLHQENEKGLSLYSQPLFRPEHLAPRQKKLIRPEHLKVLLPLSRA